MTSLLVLLYNVPFLGLSWTPLPTLIWDVINELSLVQKYKSDLIKELSAIGIINVKSTQFMSYISSIFLLPCYILSF